MPDPISRALKELDHVMLAVFEHEPALASLARLGFRVRPVRENAPMGGATAGGRGGSAAILLRPKRPDVANFVEIARADPVTAAPPMKIILRRHEGVAMLVHATDDVARVAADWKARGLDVHTFRVELTPFGPGAPFGVDIVVPDPRQPPFMFNAVRYADHSDFTRAEWLDHPNSARCWSGITYVAADDTLSALADYCAQLYGVPADRSVDGVAVIRPRDLTVTLLSDAAFRDRYGTVPEFERRERPFGAVVRFEVGDPATLAACLDAQGVAYARVDGLVRVGPRDACGAIFEFGPAT